MRNTTDSGKFLAEFLAMMQQQNSELQQASSFFRNRPGNMKLSGDLSV